MFKIIDKNVIEIHYKGSNLLTNSSIKNLLISEVKYIPIKYNP